MTAAPNTISLSLKDNEEMRNVLMKKKPGDDCRLEVLIQINELNEEMMVGTVEEAAPVDYPADIEALAGPDAVAGEEATLPPVDESQGPSPAMIAMRGKRPPMEEEESPYAAALGA